MRAIQKEIYNDIHEHEHTGDTVVLKVETRPRSHAKASGPGATCNVMSTAKMVKGVQNVRTTAAAAAARCKRPSPTAMAGLQLQRPMRSSQAHQRCTAVVAPASLRLAYSRVTPTFNTHPHRSFHATGRTLASTQVKPYLLADVGEGITECELVKWHVKPGSHIDEFDLLCEVQSDKASVEITSRFSGVVRDLSCSVGGIIKVGEPLCYIETQEAVEAGSSGAAIEEQNEAAKKATATSARSSHSAPSSAQDISRPTQFEANLSGFKDVQRTPSTNLETLAVPAVRRLCREYGIEITAVSGSGKDGRVTKEDVLRYLGQLESSSSSSSSSSFDAVANAASASQELEEMPMIQDSDVPRGADVPGEPSLAFDNVRARYGRGAAATQSEASTVTPAASEPQPQPLNGIRKAMFKMLSPSASIPVFTFAEEIDVTELEGLRRQLNATLAEESPSSLSSETKPAKVTLLAFLLKALSAAMKEHPLFLSKLQLPPQPSGSSSADFAAQASAARLVPRRSHDISIALSIPQGLLTPTIRSIESHTVLSLASHIAKLQQSVKTKGGLGAEETGDGGTLTLSNIGSVGGGLLGTTPVLPPTGQLAIGAVGRVMDLPRYADTVPGRGRITRTRSDGDDDPAAQSSLVRRKILPVTFAGDHRVLQGTELAALVLRWKQLCEKPSLWLASMM